MMTFEDNTVVDFWIWLRTAEVFDYLSFGADGDHVPHSIGKVPVNIVLKHENIGGKRNIDLLSSTIFHDNYI